MTSAIDDRGKRGARGVRREEIMRYSFFSSAGKLSDGVRCIGDEYRRGSLLTFVDFY